MPFVLYFFNWFAMQVLLPTAAQLAPATTSLDVHCALCSIKDTR